MTRSLPGWLQRAFLRRLEVELRCYRDPARLRWLFRDIDRALTTPPPTLAQTLLADLPPAQLSATARRLLDRRGVFTVQQLCDLPPDVLVELPQVGPQTLDQVAAIRQRLREETA